MMNGKHILENLQSFPCFEWGDFSAAEMGDLPRKNGDLTKNNGEQTWLVS
jgi:hypothetical protein